MTNGDGRATDSSRHINCFQVVCTAAGPCIQQLQSSSGRSCRPLPQYTRGTPDVRAALTSSLRCQHLRHQQSSGQYAWSHLALTNVAAALVACARRQRSAISSPYRMSGTQWAVILRAARTRSGRRHRGSLCENPLPGPGRHTLHVLPSSVVTHRSKQLTESCHW